MIFSNKKQKLDSKVRFQHKQFKQKLDTARGYKRKSRQISESAFDRFMGKVGLRARWSQISFGLLLGALFYLAYVPNFLSVEHIDITGLSDAQAQEFEIAIRSEIKDRSFFDPQHNLLILNHETIIRAAERVPSLDYVSSVSKDISNQTLRIEAVAKYERFLLATVDEVYDVYNDGSLVRYSGVARMDWDNHFNLGMVKIRLLQNVEFLGNRPVFHPDLLAYMNELLPQLETLENQQLAYLTFRAPEPVEPEPLPIEESEQEELDEDISPLLLPLEPPPVPMLELPFNSSELHIIFYKNNDVRRTYRVIFDATGDSQQSIQELQFLLEQTTPERYAQLFYIDLRIPGKAFLCLENSPCSR
ncbi:MAG TPA: hypothetical protein PKD79_01935 [Candidatus Doudnabacteria bacterium]|nr:hypothetical protein [Candidatus Doudnabacteria bacterium]